LQQNEEPGRIAVRSRQREEVGVKRMAVGVLSGFVLGFGSTVLVSLALGSEGASLSPVRFSPSPVRASPSPVMRFSRSPVRASPSPVKALSKPLKFSCTYVTYTTKGVDFEQTKYVCFRRGAGQLRSLIHFSAGGSGMRFVLGDERSPPSQRRAAKMQPAVPPPATTTSKRIRRFNQRHVPPRTV
jgi:hypothetical protein